MSPAAVLLEETEGPVTRLVLNRPEMRNALSRKLLEALEAAQVRIAGDRGCRAIVIAARGPVYCSGHVKGHSSRG